MKNEEADAAAGEAESRASNGLKGDPIVAELRKLYDGIVDEPVPDHLLDLLQKLDEIERNR